MQCWELEGQKERQPGPAPRSSQAHSGMNRQASRVTRCDWMRLEKPGRLGLRRGAAPHLAQSTKKAFREVTRRQRRACQARRGPARQRNGMSRKWRWQETQPRSQRPYKSRLGICDVIPRAWGNHCRVLSQEVTWSDQCFRKINLQDTHGCHGQGRNDEDVT